MNKEKIILDTDIGDDIDDAFALLYLLMSHAYEPLGITTVFRNSEQRAHMAASIIAALGEKTKVYAGCDHPLISDPDKLNTPEIAAKEKRTPEGKYVLPQWDEKMAAYPYEQENAVSFIVRMVHRYPHQVILCGIGPLTNFALALRLDPTIAPLIKEFRLMSGGLNLSFSEWNVYCDPEASAIVYSSGAKITTIGIDTTCKLVLSDADVAELKASQAPSIQIIYGMMMKWFEHYKFAHPVMHDPLALASIVVPHYLRWKAAGVSINLVSPRGHMDNLPAGETNITISYDVEASAFLQHFKSVILGKEALSDR